MIEDVEVDHFEALRSLHGGRFAKRSGCRGHRGRLRGGGSCTTPGDQLNRSPRLHAALHIRQALQDILQVTSDIFDGGTQTLQASVDPLSVHALRRALEFEAGGHELVRVDLPVVVFVHDLEEFPGLGLTDAQGAQQRLKGRIFPHLFKFQDANGASIVRVHLFEHFDQSIAVVLALAHMLIDLSLSILAGIFDGGAAEDACHNIEHGKINKAKVQQEGHHQQRGNV
mmetsp:Transcript_44132/g.95923  ORF Transcript_44132/g.95923 Transcript_44132/m.95923 type:complete len:227 (-) Transcript_44132:640-1320(-)